jgi:hypothetical protein
MSSTSLNDAVDSEKALPGIPVLTGEPGSSTSREKGLLAIWPFNNVRSWSKQKKMRVFSAVAALLAIVVVVAVAVPITVHKKQASSGDLDTGLIDGSEACF